MATIRYYDAASESYVEHEGEVVRSGAGFTAGPEYVSVYKLDDGRYLGGVRHQDRGDLMTEVAYADTEEEATPERYR